nr:MAG TPA: hypothetical protein [Caudoviricetes sp.]
MTPRKRFAECLAVSKLCLPLLCRWSRPLRCPPFGVCELKRQE